jgi:integral membrane sensor domain MASE1
MKISSTLQARLTKLGIVLIALSLLPWAAMPFLAMPFVGLSAVQAGVAAGVLFVAAEVLFYVGIALAGKEAYTRLKDFMKSRFKAWFRRSELSADAPESVTKSSPESQKTA